MVKFKNLLLVLISFVLVTCNSVEKETTKIVIGFSQFSSETDLGRETIKSMKIEVGLQKNIDLRVKDAESSIDKQIENIEEFIEEDVDLLIVSPIAPKPLKAILNKADGLGIPIVVLNRPIEGVNYKSFIGANNYDTGVNAGLYLETLRKPLNIIQIKSWAGTIPTKQKSDGFNTITKKNTNLNIVATVQDRYDKPGIKKRLKEALNTTNNVNAIFAHTDDLASQASEVINEIGLTNTIILGVGGLNTEKGGLGLVENGIIKATILEPTGGKEAISTSIDVLNNNNILKTKLLPSVIVDSSNVGVLKRQMDLINRQELDIEKQQDLIKKQIKLYSSQRIFLIFTLLSLLIIATLLFLALKSKKAVEKQKKLLVRLIDQIANQKKEIEKIAEDLRVTNEATNNFFTGVSHDFKTPISLILSSTESLINDNSNETPLEFSLIHNNSRRLLRMVNQLLDFRRVESKKFVLKASKTDLNFFVGNIYNDFKSEAIKKSVDFEFFPSKNDLYVYIDKGLFDNILFNLLSNAFKFTPSNGNITVKVYEENNDAVISIKDTGIGIVTSEKEKIFNQFFQGSNNKQTSSGIGLYLTQEYIKLHNGDIKVNSESNKGSEFIISFPKGKSHFKPNEILNDDDIKVKDVKNNLQELDYTPSKQITTPKQTEQTEQKNNDSDKDRLLIIEDNTDLRQFLKEKLSSEYNVYESDGIDTIKDAFEIMPDIIISDVNLPEKSGFEISKILKSDIRSSHIPIIMLTALSSDQANIQGLKSGVDMFLTKPFNLLVLNQCLKTLLYNRKKLQKHYGESLGSIPLKPQDKATTKKQKNTDIERVFLSKVNQVITKNIDDSTFTVEILAEEIGLSRVQLYRKTKAVLGINISDYIQNIRLENAKDMLLENNNLSMADIAYSTGFSSPNYFSTSFKNKFGKTPNQFKKENKSRSI